MSYVKLSVAILRGRAEKIRINPVTKKKEPLEDIVNNLRDVWDRKKISSWLESIGE